MYDYTVLLKEKTDRNIGGCTYQSDQRNQCTKRGNATQGTLKLSRITLLFSEKPFKLADLRTSPVVYGKLKEEENE
ncbi:hypothetical protein TNCV_3415411 [Trichonephila clavipes]|nr:hypothetical protein TNCV_3415411 [Trichonephila clavipes]